MKTPSKKVAYLVELLVLENHLVEDYVVCGQYVVYATEELQAVKKVYNRLKDLIKNTGEEFVDFWYFYQTTRVQPITLKNDIFRVPSK